MTSPRLEFSDVVDETHNAKLRSWVESANGETSDFPIQNLPLGMFKAVGGLPRAGVAIGDSILDLALWLAGTPAPVRVSAALDTGGDERGVEQSGSAFVVCENGASVFVDVTWHHVGDGERFGVGLRAGKGTAAINPLKVWKELNGVPVNVGLARGA